MAFLGPTGQMVEYDVGHNSFNVHSNSFTQFKATLRVQLIKRLRSMECLDVLDENGLES